MGDKYVTYPAFLGILAAIFLLSVMGVFSLVEPRIKGLEEQLVGLRREMERKEDHAERVAESFRAELRNLQATIHNMDVRIAANTKRWSRGDRESSDESRDDQEDLFQSNRPSRRRWNREYRENVYPSKPVRQRIVM